MTAQRLRLGVDFGTSTTIAMLQRPDGRVQPLLFDGSPMMSSAVLLGPDGRLHTGKDAAHLARSAPERFEPNPKRRIDDTSVLLGDTEIPVKDLIVAVLSRVAHEAGRVAGPVRDLALTHPANWGQGRRSVLIEAARQLGFANVELVGEPTAAATYFARTRGANLPVGACVLVYDLGAGTCDVTLLRRQQQGFELVASDGLNDVGGLDVDAAVIAFLQATYGELWTSPAGRKQLWDDVRSAKEMLSRASGTVVMVPALGKEVPLGREQLEGLARPVLRQTVNMTRNLVLESGVPMSSVAGLFLVGGSSRIPLVATLLHEALGIAPVVAEQPELVVAEGSLYLNLAPTAGRDPQSTEISAPISAPFGASGAPTSAAPVSPTSGQFPAAPVSPGVSMPAPMSPTGMPPSPVSPSGPYSSAAPVSANPAYMNPVSAPRPQTGYPAPLRVAPPFASPAGPPAGAPAGPPAAPPPGFAAPQRGRSPALVAVLAVVGLLVVIGGAFGAYKAFGTSDPGTKANNPTAGAGNPAASGPQPVIGTSQPGKYYLQKVPEDLCKNLDASQFNSGYEKESGKPTASRQLSEGFGFSSCTVQRAHEETTPPLLASVQLTYQLYVWSDVSAATYYQKTEYDNDKLNGTMTNLADLGEEGVIYEAKPTTDGPQASTTMKLTLRDSNMRLSIQINGGRSDAGGWLTAQKDDLKKKAEASARASLEKLKPIVKR